MGVLEGAGLRVVIGLDSVCNDKTYTYMEPSVETPSKVASMVTSPSSAS